jgi:hypothetical protein
MVCNKGDKAARPAPPWRLDLRTFFPFPYAGRTPSLQCSRFYTCSPAAYAPVLLLSSWIFLRARTLAARLHCSERRHALGSLGLGHALARIDGLARLLLEHGEVALLFVGRRVLPRCPLLRVPQVPACRRQAAAASRRRQDSRVFGRRIVRLQRAGLSRIPKSKAVSHQEQSNRPASRSPAA